MLTYRKTWGNATGPNWTFARHDGKNGAVFSSFFFFASTLPCSSLRTLNCIYELSDTFSDNKSAVEISRPLFLTSTTINIWIRCRFFKNFSFLFADALEQGWVVVLSFPNSLEPWRKEFNASCILLGESCSEWHLKLASDQVCFPWLQIQAPSW